jgi:hypothetical protein
VLLAVKVTGGAEAMVAELVVWKSVLWKRIWIENALAAPPGLGPMVRKLD